MRKMILYLLVLALLCAPAQAFSGKGYPVWDSGSPVENAACGSYDGQSLRLEFDPAPDYSMVDGGIAQLCFFAHDGDGLNYLELYLMLPADVQAGDVFTQEAPQAEGCSITLYEVLTSGEDCYCAARFMGMVYPGDSSFELRIDAVEVAPDRLSMRGSLNAVLGRLAGDFPTGESIHLENITFDCSLPLTGSAGSKAPDTAPAASTPKFTLPPDYITL